MDNLLLHSKTKSGIKKITGRPPHALLIYGEPGSGKMTIAKNISASLLNVQVNKSHPYLIVVARDVNRQDIPIESIRSIIKQLGLKVTDSSANVINRIVIINEADRLSTEAQNALLKIIEEPPARTMFMLTAPSVNSVLSTISSRTEKLPVHPINLADSAKYFEKKYSNKDITAAWRLSGGAAELMAAILRDEKHHPLRQGVEQAKQFLKADHYGRLLLLESLIDDKDRFIEVLNALSRTLAALHHSAIARGNNEQASRLLNSRKLINSSLACLTKNASSRLVALQLAEQLPV